MVPLYTLLLFQDISGGELVLVLLAIFLLFGPNKLPEITKNIAKTLGKFRKYTSDIQAEVDKAIGPIKDELQGHAKDLKESFGLEDKPKGPENEEKIKNNDIKPAG
jgi:sec-independent protein translocase protein TatB